MSKSTKAPGKVGGKITKKFLYHIKPSFWKHRGFEQPAEKSDDPAVKQDVRAQFVDPTVTDDGKGYIVAHKAVLPDGATLGSFSGRGAWCIIMAGGGHFCAAIWDESGKRIQNKSFHRYTTRKKQGGSQSKADKKNKYVKYTFNVFITDI